MRIRLINPGPGFEEKESTSASEEEIVLENVVFADGILRKDVVGAGTVDEDTVGSGRFDVEDTADVTAPPSRVSSTEKILTLF